MLVLQAHIGARRRFGRLVRGRKGGLELRCLLRESREDRCGYATHRDAGRCHPCPCAVVVVVVRDRAESQTRRLSLGHRRISACAVDVRVLLLILSERCIARLQQELRDGLNARYDTGQQRRIAQRRRTPLDGHGREKRWSKSAHFFRTGGGYGR